MPKINISHAISKPAKETFTKIRDFFENDQDLRKMDSNLACQFDEGNLSGKATGSQFKANFQIKEASDGSKLELVVDLPLLLTPFKGKIEETIQKKLAKYLA